MQRYGYELIQADTYLWLVGKKDDFAAPIPVSTGELKELLAAHGEEDFGKKLAEIHTRPLPEKAIRKNRFRWNNPSVNF